MGTTDVTGLVFLFQTSKDSDGEEEEDSDDSDDYVEETLESKIPKSHECKMVHGDKAITALTIDPSGSRLASG